MAGVKKRAENIRSGNLDKGFLMFKCQDRRMPERIDVELDGDVEAYIHLTHVTTAKASAQGRKIISAVEKISLSSCEPFPPGSHCVTPYPVLRNSTAIAISCSLLDSCAFGYSLYARNRLEGDTHISRPGPYSSSFSISLKSKTADPCSSNPRTTSLRPTGLVIKPKKS